MEKEIKLDTVNLIVGNKTIELTIEEAKKLKKVLEELFGKEIIKEVIHEHHYDWWYRPYYLCVGEIKPIPTYEPYVTINCSTQKNSLDISL